MAQVLSVSPIHYDRLSPRQGLRTYLGVTQEADYSLDNIPDVVSLEWMLERIAVSDRTLLKYRVFAYDKVKAYSDSCLRRNPRYAAKKVVVLQKRNKGKRAKTVYPDQPPFQQIEAQILIAIAGLYDRYKSTPLVEYHIKSNPDFYLP